MATDSTTIKNNSSEIEIPSVFVSKDENPYEQIKWTERNSQIYSSDGNLVSDIQGIEVPETWSQLATDIVASKYFRKAGVPQFNVTEVIDGKKTLENAKQTKEVGAENSVRSLVFRVAHTIMRSGLRQGYFKDKKNAQQFEKELTHILLNQKAAFNSPVWFNCGLSEIYDIKGSEGNFSLNFDTRKIEELNDSYKSPQCSACLAS